MKLTEQLSKEHSQAREVLHVVNKICANLALKGDIKKEHFSQVMEFFKKYIDKSHHTKEENCLFPALEKIKIKHHETLLETMLMEHNLVRHYVKGLEESYLEIKNGNQAATQPFIENGTSYIKFLLWHMDKEDKELFPLAEKLLDETTKREIETEFEKIDFEVRNPKMHEEITKSLKEMKTFYGT